MVKKQSRSNIMYVISKTSSISIIFCLVNQMFFFLEVLRKNSFYSTMNVFFRLKPFFIRYFITNLPRTSDMLHEEPFGY